MRVFVRILREARNYWTALLCIFLLSIFTAPLALLQPLPIKIVVDYAIGSEPLPEFISSLVPANMQDSDTLIIGLALLDQVVTLGLQLMQTHTGEGMLLDFRARLFGYTQRLSLRYHDSKGASESTFRIQYDAPSILAILIHGVIPIVTATATLCGMIYVTAQIDKLLAIIALFISPILFLLARAFATPLKERWTTVKGLESSAHAVVQEALSSMRVVKAFSREDYEEERFLTRSLRYKQELLNVFFMQGRFNVLIGVTIGAGMAATLFVGAQHVQDGTLSLGNLLLALAYASMVYAPLRTISSQFGALQGAIVSAERAFSLLDEEPEVVELDNANRIERAKGGIEFKNVSFGYESGQRILHNINFTAAAGTIVGIQGLTGAGKSSLISLLTRFYDVDEGVILLDGVDIRNYKLQDYRSQFSVVLQDPVLFSASIAENIAYGRPSADEREIVEAAKLANAHEFIVALKDGYETAVGARGILLSGGERQRISLARAFLRDAPVLVLDEPTSSVDPKTESAILETMHKLMRGRTTFMISHRLSTLKSCNMRLVVARGRVTVLQSKS